MPSARPPLSRLGLLLITLGLLAAATFTFRYLNRTTPPFTADPIPGTRPITDLTDSVAYITFDPTKPPPKDNPLARQAAGDPTAQVVLPVQPHRTPPPHTADSSDPPAAPFVGAAACAECHQQRYDSFLQTAHANTSRISTADNVLGPFDPQHATLTTADPDLSWQMQLEDGRPALALLVEQNGELYTHRQPLDLTIGSGRYGQTHLYWLDDGLYQLHVSYLTEDDRWVNSPGFEDGAANLARPVTARCMECHATYIQPIPESLNRFNPATFMAGVTCERCHGPGAEHIERHTANPFLTSGVAITNPGLLQRDLSMQVCAQCHASGGDLINDTDAFSYRPGQPLEQHLVFEPQDPDAADVGVHSTNQVLRLELSQCFIQSPQMTCATCHNPHRTERGDTALFSRRCTDCHESPTHTSIPAELKSLAATNCIDCHVPFPPSADMTIQNHNGLQHIRLRDHYIAVWPNETRQWIDTHSVNPPSADADQ